MHKGGNHPHHGGNLEGLPPSRPEGATATVTAAPGNGSPAPMGSIIDSVLKARPARIFPGSHDLPPQTLERVRYKEFKGIDTLLQTNTEPIRYLAKGSTNRRSPTAGRSRAP